MCIRDRNFSVRCWLKKLIIIWKLFLSVTNSDDGKIEKNPATRNLNKANTGYQWSSTSGSGSIASGDRGLGLEKKYYISLSEIKTSSKSLPARLSSVGAGEGKTSNYYLYKTSVSKQKSKKMEPSGTKLQKPTPRSLKAAILQTRMETWLTAIPSGLKQHVRLLKSTMAVLLLTCFIRKTAWNRNQTLMRMRM